jgi:hypothetical protein
MAPPAVEAPVELQGVFLRKHRFCATFPTVNKCKQGNSCPYAHSRADVLGPVCSENEERLEGVNPEFFMWTYKTLWCPIGSFHDWQECIYAHNYQDLRRDPRIGYSTQVCPDWERANRSPTYRDRCPRGFGCGYAHGAKEQLYHPGYFHSVMCNDHFHGKGCPRGKTCAFFHKKKEKRASPPWPDHGDSIPKPVLDAFLQPDIEFPPFAPADTGARSQRQDDEMPGGVPAGAPGELWLQMMLQVGMEASLPGLGLGVKTEPKLWPDENQQSANIPLPWEKDAWAFQLLGQQAPGFDWAPEMQEATPEPRRRTTTRRRKKPSK